METEKLVRARLDQRRKPVVIESAKRGGLASVQAAIAEEAEASFLQQQKKEILKMKR